MSDLNRIRWKCRRGTLELDLVLIDFVDRHYSSLTQTEKDAFFALLERGDDELWSLISTNISPDQDVPGTIIERLRAC